MIFELIDVENGSLTANRHQAHEPDAEQPKTCLSARKTNTQWRFGVLSCRSENFAHAKIWPL
jgi:hypothetical protein